jgi:anaerobic magnesium-protoporphyrin IX monomethyl ester cyclase
MSKTIDCFIIGHNELAPYTHIKRLKEMGLNSGTYRDLNLGFIQKNSNFYHASDFFNFLFCSDHSLAKGVKPLHPGETFSATIAYLGTYLHRRGLTFDFVNSFNEEKEELARKIAQENILTFAVTTTLYVSIFPLLEVIEFVKRFNQTAKIIIGGPFVSNQAAVLGAMDLDYTFKSIGADFYVNSSQGETALVKIIKALKTNSSPERIYNIYYKTDNGYAAASVLPENNQLSENMVDWHLFSGRVGEYANIRTAVSCPFSCAFCGFPQHAGVYQIADVEAIEKELNRLEEIGTVKLVHFIDDTFNVPGKRFKEIQRMLIRNRYTFKWISNLRCQFLDREMIELMKKSGCEGVFLGIESGNDQILKNMNKVTSVEKYIEGISLLKEFEIVTYGSFIIGFPGETEETVQDTVHFIKESGIDFYRAQLWYCEPITPIWKEREKYNLKGSGFEWQHATMDAKKASSLIEEMFLSIDKATWIPQYNFDFNNLFHLTHRGIRLEEVRKYLQAFNKGIWEKLMDLTGTEVSDEIIGQAKRSITEINGYQTGWLIGETVEKGENPREDNFDTSVDIDFNLDSMKI